MISFEPSGIVTLTTDFGLSDTYVGQMKGVILSVDPSLRIVDLTHGVDPQDIEEGAFQLRSALSVFQPGAVHIAVVDPGVGTERRAIVVEAQGQLWIAPDNGLLSHVLDYARAIHLIENQRFHRAAAAPTFHGRDLFAPVGAQLASGECALDEVGPLVDLTEPVKLPPSVRLSAAGVEGRIVSIDRFGNCITLVARENIGNSTDIEQIKCRDFRVAGLDRTFSDVPPGSPIAYMGSSNTLELAVRDGSAARQFGLGRGDTVTVRRRRTDSESSGRRRYTTQD